MPTHNYSHAREEAGAKSRSVVELRSVAKFWKRCSEIVSEVVLVAEDRSSTMTVTLSEEQLDEVVRRLAKELAPKVAPPPAGGLEEAMEGGK